MKSESLNPRTFSFSLTCIGHLGLTIVGSRIRPSPKRFAAVAEVDSPSWQWRVCGPIQACNLFPEIFPELHDYSGALDSSSEENVEASLRVSAGRFLRFPEVARPSTTCTSQFSGEARIWGARWCTSLLQRDPDGWQVVISYASRKLLTPRRIYTTTRLYALQ